MAEDRCYMTFPMPAGSKISRSEYATIIVIRMRHMTTIAIWSLRLLAARWRATASVEGMAIVSDCCLNYSEIVRRKRVMSKLYAV